MAADAPLSSVASTLANGQTGSYYSGLLDAVGGVLPYSWSITVGSLPPGLALDKLTGDITGTPTSTGVFAFSAAVNDSSQPTAQSVTATYSIEIDSPPLGVNQAVPSGVVGQSYAANVTPTNGTGPYSWILESGALPNGLTFDSSTGAILGIPLQSGTFPLEIQVADAATQETATSNLELVINPPTVLGFTNLDLVDGSIGFSYAAALGWVGGNGPNQWSITSGVLPNGLDLDPISGMITGDPTTSGSYPITVQVADSSTPNPEVASANVTLTIDDAPAETITTTSLQDAAIGTPYQAQLTVSGGVAPFTWGIASGQLPQGITLDSSDGVISGTPSESDFEAFSVLVTDGIGQTAFTDLTLTVDAPSLSLSTTTLATATVGVAYDAPLSANGGLTPYSWSISSGDLPPGLALSPTTGDVAGTPSSGGVYSFVAQVEDSNAVIATAASVNFRRCTVVLAIVPSTHLRHQVRQSIGALWCCHTMQWKCDRGEVVSVHQRRQCE